MRLPTKLAAVVRRPYAEIIQMKAPLLAYFGYICAIALSSDTGSRRIDFANHEFSWRETDGWPDHLVWLSTSETNRVQLVNGRWKVPDYDIPRKYRAGLTLDEVTYGNLTGEDTHEAVVVLRYDSGGVQYYYWVYIYGTTERQAKLLGYFHAGDRAAQGLYRVYILDHKLVVELYDPEKAQGGCCSSGFIRTRYEWNGHTFSSVGAVERGRAESVSRRSVSVFGIPYSPKRPDNSRH